MIQDIAQSVILVTGLSGCILHTFPNFAAKRWAFRASLVAQPFWYYSAWLKHQWGVQILAFVFFGMAARGLWTHRIKKRVDESERSSISQQTLN